MNPDFPETKTRPQFVKAPVVFTAISALAFILLGIFGVLFLNNQGSRLFQSPQKGVFEKFRSEEELRQYFTETSKNAEYFNLGGSIIARDLTFASSPMALEQGGAPAVGRVSTTNVQVTGLDEPDIVKTNGKNIFASVQNYTIMDRPFTQELIAPDVFPPSYYGIKVVSALPPTDIELASEVKSSGDMLLEGNVLMVFTYNKVSAFNVSNSQNPASLWEYDFDENFSYNTARLREGKVYLVTSRYADYSLPCPVPLLEGMADLKVACTDIYHPGGAVSINTMYSIVKLDPGSGLVEDSISFVGDSGSGVVYMSPGAVYTTFTSYPSPLEFMANFLAENSDLFGNELVSRVNNLRGVDISNESKINELGIIFQKYLSGLTNDERERVKQELENRMNDYLKAHGRELQVSSIVKVNVENLDVVATGEVPGAPLNQFSLDEYNGNLRIATTLSASTMFGRGESANDVYVLDQKLGIVGQLQGLALGESIFSARFIENKAYLVTFKQIDPFFVIDLSSPSNPRVAGELKIPGFSSYLHPLSTNKILGVGQEGSQSKLSLFDVSNPSAPVEIDKYLLADYYSEVQNNHRAFLQDPDKGVFFLPAGSNAYIFSWAGGLKLERVVTGLQARRAVYINNYLYIVGDQEIVVLNESNWEEASRLTL